MKSQKLTFNFAGSRRSHQVSETRKQSLSVANSLLPMAVNTAAVAVGHQYLFSRPVPADEAFDWIQAA